MQEIRLIYRNSNSKYFRPPEEVLMNEQQERKEIRTEGYEFLIFSVEILMLLLILYYMRTVVLSREGCTVSWLFWKRNYKWEELAVIREDVWYTYGKGGSIRYQGIVFSKYAVNKLKKKYTTLTVVDSFQLSDFIYIYYLQIVYKT